MEWSQAHVQLSTVDVSHQYQQLAFKTFKKDTRNVFTRNTKAN